MNIYDISKKAGVSIATVSRVLNGSDKVSETTRQKVLDAPANSMEEIRDALDEGRFASYKKEKLDRMNSGEAKKPE